MYRITWPNAVRLSAGLSSTLVTLILASTICRAQDSSGQYVAKLYTEALGRAPDASGFNSYFTYIKQNGCSVSTGQAVASAILLSSEFDSDYKNPDGSYDNAARVETLFRALVNREPTQNEYDYTKSILDNQRFTWNQVVLSIIQDQEFGNLIQNVVCVTLRPGAAGYYGWGGGLQLDRSAGHGPGVPSGTFTGSSGADLAAALDQLGQAGGGTLTLSQGALIPTDRPIVIPRGVTLQTVGNPPATQYGRMARIVRYSNFTNAGMGPNPIVFGVITVAGGGTLTGVWIEGNVTNTRGYNGGCPVRSSSDATRDCLTVTVLGDDTTEAYQTIVANTRISDTDGWSSLTVFGDANIYIDPGATYGACSSTTVPVTLFSNLITLYGTFHGGGPDSMGRQPWSDGISSECNTTIIASNDIVDATDGGIVVFGTSLTQKVQFQRSRVNSNNVINAGNPAFYSINFANRTSGDANVVANSNCIGGSSQDFTNAIVQYNYIWTAEGTFVDFAIVAGNVGTGANGDPSLTGAGLKISNNASGPNRVNTTIGLLISGMCRSEASQNYLDTNISDHLSISGCFSGSSVVAVAGHAEYSNLPSGYYYFTPNQGSSICIAGNADHR